MVQKARWLERLHPPGRNQEADEAGQTKRLHPPQTAFPRDLFLLARPTSYKLHEPSKQQSLRSKTLNKPAGTSDACNHKRGGPFLSASAFSSPSPSPSSFSSPPPPFFLIAVTKLKAGRSYFGSQIEGPTHHVGMAWQKFVVLGGMAGTLHISADQDTEKGTIGALFISFFSAFSLEAQPTK